jgi:lipoprotein-anchoring transpeptidase ErfK/SrfK
MKRAWGLWVAVVVFGTLFSPSGASGQNSPETPADAPARLEAVRLQGLCLLAAPDARAATVKVLRAGEVVRVVSEQGMWTRVEARGGVVGFVSGGYLTGASVEAPALYRDRLVAAARPGPKDAPGTLVGITPGPEPAAQAPAQAPAAQTPVAEAMGTPVPAGTPLAEGQPVSMPSGPADPAAASGASAPPLQRAATPAADPGGIDRLVASVLKDLRQPAESAPTDRLDAAAREYRERKSRYSLEVYLADCTLVLYEKQADGVRRPARTYAVATPAGDVEPPAGWGVITQIEFEPWWRPTENMKRRARQKGRTLPDVMPPGVKNPMGPFKMHLSHGFAFRIHGNNDPKSIGRRVTNGCIRMRNDEGLELARILDVGTEVVIYDHAPPQVGQGAEAAATRP